MTKVEILNNFILSGMESGKDSIWFHLEGLQVQCKSKACMKNFKEDVRKLLIDGGYEYFFASNGDVCIHLKDL